MLMTLLTQRLPIDNTPINISRHFFDSHDASSETRTYPDRLTDRQMHKHTHITQKHTETHTNEIRISHTHRPSHRHSLFHSHVVTHYILDGLRHRQTQSHTLNDKGDRHNPTHTQLIHTHSETHTQTHIRHKLLAAIKNKGLFNSRLGVTWYLQTGSPQSPVTWLTPALFIRPRNPYNRYSFQGITPWC